MRISQTSINGKHASWNDRPDIQALWEEKVMTKLKEGEWVTTANYYEPRPYVDEYNRGSNREGFVYTLQPGNHVCYWERIK